MKKVITSIVLAGSILVAGVFVTSGGLAGGREIDNNQFDKWEANEIVAEQIIEKVGQRSIEQIRQQMHEMSHQVIVASHKWGNSPLTEEAVNKLIIEVTDGGYYNDEKEVLLEILSRWKKADFSIADKDHNIIWNIQGGTVGEAVDVDADEYMNKWGGK